MTRREFTTGLRRLGLFAIAVALVAFAVLHRKPPEERWLDVQGTVQDTRIVADHALQTKSGGQITWKAEYRVLYSVGGHDYTVWADSGTRDESEDGVRLALQRSPASCPVQYRPRSPGVAIADCR